MKTYVIEGKYTNGPGSAYEIIDTVTPEEGGLTEAKRLTQEYRMAHKPHPVRYRPATPADLA